MVHWKNNQVEPNYNYALSQVFSPSLLKKINDPAYEEDFRQLLQATSLYPENKPWNFVQAFEITYSYLKRNYRCEYVYMNEIANQLLLKYHNDNSATLLKELTSDGSIADVVIINGATVAYEIKTELDSFERLDKQLESYQTLYDYVFVVTYPKAVDVVVKKISPKTGIIVLEKDNRLNMRRTAEYVGNEFNPLKAVFTLRQSELVAAYNKYEGDLPSMGTALIYEYCHQWYIRLEKEQSHQIFNEALKSRKPSPHQFALISKCNLSLRMMFFGKELSKKYCNITLTRLGIFV